MIERVLAANPGQAEQYRGGKQGLLGFFVGQVMKETGGKADPRVVNERVRASWGEPGAMREPRRISAPSASRSRR